MAHSYNSEQNQQIQSYIKSTNIKPQQKLYALSVVFVPMIFALFSFPISFFMGIHLIDIWMCVIMVVLSLIGIELGYHRYFSHQSFQTNKIFRLTLAILGCMAGEGPPIYWVANHRRHHQYSDQPKDPHSPNLVEKGIKNQLFGLWHAHIGWILNFEITNTVLYAKDLLRDPALSRVNQYYFVWLSLGFVIPAIIEGIITKSLLGLFSGFLWGGIIRLFLAQQLTYSVNSLCHVYGSRPLKSKDYSTNVWWLAIPTLGGSWHNNHHAFPNTAINQFEWWQIDLGGWFIRACEVIGLTWDLKVPTQEMIHKKKLH